MSLKTKKIFILITDDAPNNVILNHAAYAKEAGFSPIFVFPHRENSQNHEHYYSEYEFIRLNFVFKNTTAYQYLVSILRLIAHTTKRLLSRSDVEHILAVDLTGTLASLMLKIRGARIYTLVNDNFSARYNLGPVAFKILRFIEGVTYKYLSTACFFPDQSRYELLGSPRIRSIHIVPNILPDSFAPQYKGGQDGKLTVLFCGWLVKSRGLELIAEILQETSREVEILLIGSGDSLLINELSKSARVTYWETVPREKMLKIMSEVDINFAFYNPTILINRFACPQKVYDSLLVGCPVFINSEVAMTGSLSKAGTCITAEYFDVRSISGILNALLLQKNNLWEISKSIKVFRTNFASFAQVKSTAVEIYKSFAELRS